jgi:predicted RNase H-like nuclease
MTYIAGVDGCRGGWIAVSKEAESGILSSELHPSARSLVRGSSADVLAVDIPVGLTDQGQRQCDVEARRKLGKPRSSSVFSPPVRPVISRLTPGTSRENASSFHRKIDGRGLGVQTWGIVPKIQEVDSLLRQEPNLQSRVREVHPEVSFCTWAGRPMQYSKKRRKGRSERLLLVNEHFGADAFDSVRAKYLAKEVGHDDILDAFAALWTAERILGKVNGTLPAVPPLDSAGLRMEIVY